MSGRFPGKLVKPLHILRSQDAGFFALDLGGLREGGRMQQVGAPLAGHNLIRLP